MAYAALTLEIKDHIAHLVFNRPEAMNAMNRDMWREIPEAINAIDVDASARVIVISALGKHFTAGMDLSVFGKPGPYKDAEIGRKRAHLRTDIMRMQECFTAFERARMPVIAAIQGGQVGAENRHRIDDTGSDGWGCRSSGPRSDGRGRGSGGSRSDGGRVRHLALNATISGLGSCVVTPALTNSLGAH